MSHNKHSRILRKLKSSKALGWLANLFNNCLTYSLLSVYRSEIKKQWWQQSDVSTKVERVAFP